MTNVSLLRRCKRRVRIFHSGCGIEHCNSCAQFICSRFRCWISNLLDSGLVLLCRSCIAHRMVIHLRLPSSFLSSYLNLLLNSNSGRILNFLSYLPIVFARCLGVTHRAHEVLCRPDHTKCMGWNASPTIIGCSHITLGICRIGVFLRFDIYIQIYRARRFKGTLA